MAYFDQNEMFGDNQDLSQIVGTYLFDHSIDTGASDTPALGGPLVHDFGRANDRRKILAIVDEAFVSAGGGTCQLQIVQADDAALTSNLQVLRETRALTAAELTLGSAIAMAIPSMSKRYLGLRGNIATATTTAGTLTAGLADQVPSNAQHNVY